MVSSYLCTVYGFFIWSLEILVKMDEPIAILQRALFLVSTICTWSLVLTCHQGILERLDAGEVIIGDGSYVNTLEKRGYVKVEILSRASIVVKATATNTLTARWYTLCFHYYVLQRRATTRPRAVSSIHRQWSNWHKSEIFYHNHNCFDEIGWSKEKGLLVFVLNATLQHGKKYFFFLVVNGL